MDQYVYKKIGDLPPVYQLTGEELLEVTVGGRSHRISASLLFSAGESAYQIAQRAGFQGTEQEWLESLVGAEGAAGEQGPQGVSGQDGKSAYEIAVEQGFQGDLQLWMQSLTGTQGPQGVAGVDGKSAYQQAVEAGYTGTQEEFLQTLVEPKSLAGGVFITDITPQNEHDNIGQRIKSDDGYCLQQCLSTSKFVRVHMTAITGFSSYVPRITVNGVDALVSARSDAPIFDATADIELGDPVSGFALVRAEHADGAFWETEVGLDSPPQIQSAVFASPYPSTQTELKQGDTMSVSVTTDVDVIAYEIANSGAFVAASGEFAHPGREHVIENLEIANRGIVSKLYGFQIRVKKSTGAWSQWYGSASSEQIELVTTARLCNLYPTIVVNSTTYPAGQEAIKNGEFAIIDHTVTDFDSIAYGSVELDVEQPDIYEQSKKAHYASGSYNAGTNNLTISARRHANGAVTTQTHLVRIASIEPVVAITTPAARLRSGGNAGTSIQRHVITLTASQALVQPPSLNAPEGAWVEPSWTPNAAKTVWTRRLAVHDDDAKGTFTFNSLSAVGLSGLTQSSIDSGSDYTLGGFVFRTLTVAGYPNREAAIGTQVTNVAKLRCTNLSKGVSGSLNFSYQPDTSSNIGKYTITGPSGVANPVGDIWYNADSPNATSNTGGTMQIEIEETV